MLVNSAEHPQNTCLTGCGWTGFRYESHVNSSYRLAAFHPHASCWCWTVLWSRLFAFDRLPKLAANKHRHRNTTIQCFGRSEFCANGAPTRSWYAIFANVFVLVRFHGSMSTNGTECICVVCVCVFLCRCRAASDCLWRYSPARQYNNTPSDMRGECAGVSHLPLSQTDGLQPATVDLGCLQRIATGWYTRQQIVV